MHAVVVLQHLLVVKGSGKADHTKVSQLLVVAIFFFFLLTFQVAIYKFLAMHEKYHLNFIIDNGGNSVAALKAVTGKPDLQLMSYFAHNWISSRPQRKERRASI